MFFCNEKMCSTRNLFIFSYNSENNSSTTFSWGKDRLDNGRGIRNWKEIYLLYRGWSGTPLYIWQRESRKGFEGRKKRTKNVKSTIETNKYSERFSQNISALHHFCFSFVPVLASDIFWRLKSVVYILHLFLNLRSDWICQVLVNWKQ